MHEPVSHGSQTLSVGLALATALGMSLGFLPKDSLAFYAVLAAALLLPTNLVVLTLGTLVFHLLGWYGTPLFHKLGAILLTDPRLVATWSYLAEIPLVPWTRFQNTVVMGALASSLLLFWPVFLFSLPVFGRVAPTLQQALTSSTVYRWLVHSGPTGEHVA